MRFIEQTFHQNHLKRFLIRFSLLIVLLLISQQDLSAQFIFDFLKSKSNHPKETAAMYSRMADKAYNNGKVKKSINYLKKSLALDANNEQYINRLAKIYHTQGAFKKALRYLTRKRLLIQDTSQIQAAQMMNWEGYYALSNGLRRQAILRFAEAAHWMDKYQLKDSLLKASIYCNWGVAELYDQGKNDPCETSLMGECYLIHITDVRRAVERFEVALKFNPDECYKAARWNYAFTRKMLKISKDTLTRYMGYLPWNFIDSIKIAVQDTFCYVPPTQKNSIETPTELNLTAFKNISKYEEVLYVLDISGSMSVPVSNEVKISRFELMTKLIEEEISKADSTQKVGMLTVGGDCPTKPYIRIPVDTANQQLIKNTLYTLRPNGGTPLFSTLQISPQYFTSEKNKKIILLASDGLESCLSNQSVCQLAEDLCNQGIKIEVFSLLLDERANYNAYGLYQCMSNACQTDFTGLNKSGKIEDKSIIMPVDYYSMTIDREDILKGAYNSPTGTF